VQNSDIDSVIGKALLGFISIILIFAAFSIIFAYTDKSERNITVHVHDKRPLHPGHDSCGITLILTDIGIFKNMDSAAHGKFNSTSLYKKIKIGRCYIFRVVGQSIPLLGHYPNIISIKEIRCKNK